MNYLIAANWKMNGSKEFIESYLSAINIEDNPDVKMLICPPDWLSE
jgi:Triosephosphate isomerase